MIIAIKKYIGVCLSLIFLVLLAATPTDASESVKKALEICSGIILPSLLPFFFISGIISAIGLPAMLAKSFSGIMSRLFGFSGYAATPLILGFLGGYPVGAASLAQLTLEGRINKEEAERLLPVCNNTGPAFIIGAVGGGIFHSAAVGIMLYAVHIAASLSLGIMFAERDAHTASNTVTIEDFEYRGLISAIPSAVKGAVEKSLNICGFVIFFSVFSAILEELGLISSVALLINKTTGLEIGFCRSLPAGIMELGGGIASMGSLSPAPRNYALAAFILGFGSLSVHCQTLAVTADANIKCARHFAGRIIHGVLSALYAFVISSILKI